MLRTNAAGRRAYNPEFKAWIVEQACVPGMTVAGLAMRNQVNANQLRHWVLLHQRGRSSAQTASPRLLPVTVADDSRSAGWPGAVPGRAAPVEIEWAGAVVRVHEGASAATLGTVLSVLKQLP
ncbi:MAG: IS66-like element accessory protein TnpA [Rubrivivax sp.]